MYDTIDTKAVANEMVTNTTTEIAAETIDTKAATDDTKAVAATEIAADDTN
jgi:hypothetical protein